MLDPEVKEYIRNMPEDYRGMIFIVMEDVANGEMDPEEGMKYILAVIKDYEEQVQ